MSARLKDDVLAELAGRWNVAQFASFGPGDDPPLRHLRVSGAPPASGLDLGAAVRVVLAGSPRGTVNVRAFSAERPKGNPFHYGLDRVDAVEGLVRSLGAQGFFTIVNETIDVHDGGVSGVRLGDVVEFAPGGTPRVVEEQGVASLPAAIAAPVIAAVYGAALPAAGAGTRLEFSIHPNGVGLRHERVVVWEVEDDQGDAVGSEPLRPHWPNRFSEHIGDKTFGLLMADSLGAPVPHTEVIARSTPPFRFGRPTGHDSRWLRTAPRRFAAGRYTTARHWVDPFELLAKEDPTGREIGAVLVQDGVRAAWSGAARLAEGSTVVEGVAGPGDAFMVGQQPPAELPGTVAGRVATLGRDLVARLGPIRLEWADDGEGIWVLQLNQLATAPDDATDDAGMWLDFDPNDGLDVLRSLIQEVTTGRAQGAGIRVVRPIGITSHVGDLLRQAGVAARFAR
jgi:hypothetical protein